jgi:hypothetical protein
MSTNTNSNAILNQLFARINQQGRRTQTNFQPEENPRNAQPRNQNQTPENNRYGNTYNDHIRRQQHLIGDLLDDYNHQINNYTRNLDRIIDLLQLLQNNLDTQLAQNINNATNNNARTNVRNNNQPQNNGNNGMNENNNYNRRLRNTLYNYNIVYPIEFEWLARNTRENLTTEQIDTSTEDITYSSSMNETKCPITWEDFNEGEHLMKIKHCGHYFKRTNLMNWLRRENTCPVCRYDLRDYTNNNTTNADLSDNNIGQREQSAENENQPIRDDTDDDDLSPLINQDSRNHIADNLSGIVREVLSNMTNRETRNLYDSSSNIIAEYSFEFF